jgi:hypothetical protein
MQGALTLVADSDHDGDRSATVLDAGDLDLAAAVGAVIGVAIGLPICRRVSQSLDDSQALLTDEVGDGDDGVGVGVLDTASTHVRGVDGQVATLLHGDVLAPVCNWLESCVNIREDVLGGGGQARGETDDKSKKAGRGETDHDEHSAVADMVVEVPSECIRGECGECIM